MLFDHDEESLFWHHRRLEDERPEAATRCHPVLGDITYKNQNNEKFWTVGQWQNGVFYGVSSTGHPGEKAVKVKSAWK